MTDGPTAAPGGAPRETPGRADGPDRGPDDTAERPRVVDDGPTEVPETSPWVRGSPSAPPPARYPLYADEVTEHPEHPGSPEHAEHSDAGAVLPVVPTAGPAAGAGRRRRTALPWVVGAVVVLLLAGCGAVLLLGGLGGLGTASGGGDSTGSGQVGVDRETGEPTATPNRSPTQPPTATPPSARPLQPVDVSGQASVTASSTAPPSTDVGGDPVRYDAANVLDGDPSTAWRTAGDGRGAELALTLAEPTVVTRLGLVNGYAKSQAGYDGYTANRRVTGVDWVLGDGTVVAQRGLGETTSVQGVAVDDVRTRTVTLRVRGTTAPGSVDGRDFTAISEVRVVGDPR